MSHSTDLEDIVRNAAVQSRGSIGAHHLAIDPDIVQSRLGTIYREVVLIVFRENCTAELTIDVIAERAVDRALHADDITIIGMTQVILAPSAFDVALADRHRAGSTGDARVGTADRGRLRRGQ